MKLVCFSFSEKGAALGRGLEQLDGIYTITHVSNGEYKGGIKGFLKENWTNFQGFIFIGAAGIAIRMIHPYIKNKAVDPAIIVVDDCGKYAIPILSGHIGGANEIALWIGKEMAAIPVITTASDNRDIESVDIFAKKNNYHMVDMKSVTEITAMMVNRKKIGFYSEDKEIIRYDHLEIIDDLDTIDEELDGMILISSREDLGMPSIPCTILRPKNINIGIGCRKGIHKDIVLEAIEAALNSKKLSSHSINIVGTIEVKKNEQGIIEAAKYLNCPLKIFTIEEIAKYDHLFEKSQFVKDTIGVYSVSEPCAYQLGGELVVRKFRRKGVTVSISKI